MIQTVCVIAAHPDDEVLGCGGTIARLAREGAAVHVLLLADGEGARAATAEAIDSRAVEARNRSADASAAILGCASIRTLDLPDNRLDRLEMLDVVKLVEHFVEQHRPSTVFTHHGGDVNVDHRVVHEAVIAACRPQPNHPVREMLFFETASSTEWRPAGSSSAFIPNWFVDITDTIGVKMAALQAYESEMREFPHARSMTAVQALAAWRGATAGVTAAEAFILGRKITR
jgi:LmbE family N-acetylglucosaminyl deacetylase